MSDTPPALRVEYIGSYQDAGQCPLIQAPEHAFIGRSHVGKSSMINYLTGLSELARTSKKPGKRQAINLFQVRAEPEWVIADLPGYGYAKVSRDTRKSWSKMIERYVLHRKNLLNLFLLIDMRHPPQEPDMQFLRFLGENEVPFCILFTKSDQLKPDARTAALEVYTNALLEEWESLPPYVVTSSIARRGREEILNLILEMNTIFTRQQAT